MLLLVEDEPTVRSLMKRTLVEEGFRVLEAGDGLEALRVFASEPEIRLVVSDVMMPRMNGYELAARLPPELPVVFATGFGQPHTQHTERGPILTKPIQPEILVRAVKAFLHH